MCGIAGVYSPTGIRRSDRECVSAMVSTLNHRGPDDRGVQIVGNVVLGHALLSIIDIGGGHQPLSNEDDTVWVTYNGEIYNYQQLQKELIAKGHRFKTKTDTEVLVHLYEEYGTDFVHYLDGMFAFALWDAKKDRLILVRDRLGVKPLLWTQVGGRTYFASELKALVRNTPVEFDIDPVAIDHYLAFKHVGPGRSILKSVNKVPPGHFVVLDKTGFEISTYWIPVPRNLPGDPREDIRKLLSQATKSRLKAEVPISVSLSGGIDSSIILYEVAQNSQDRSTAFSIRYPGAVEDESEVATRFAKSLGVDHHIVDFPGLDFDILPKLAEIMDEPFGDYSAYPSHLLFGAHRTNSTVVLTGDGGDEAFGGYKRYQLSNRLSQLRQARGILAPFLKSIGVNQGGVGRLSKLLDAVNSTRDVRYENVLSMLSPRQRSQLMAPSLNAKLGDVDSRRYLTLGVGAHNVNNLESILDYLLYLPGDVLTKVDLTSMAHSVEVRSPFLDWRVVEYGLSLAPSQRIGRGGTKVGLRNAYRGAIPDEILDGKKRGFTVPMAYWRNAAFRDFARDILLSKPALERGIFSKQGLEHMIDSAFAMEVYNPRHVWNALMLELWFQAYTNSGND